MATITISGEASLILRNEFIEKFGFRDILPGARFAFAYAILHNLNPVYEKSDSGKPLTWSADAIQPLVDIVKIFRPDINIEYTDENLLNYVRGLIHAGIYDIEKEWKCNPKMTIFDLLPKI